MADTTEAEATPAPVVEVEKSSEDTRSISKPVQEDADGKPAPEVTNAKAVTEVTSADAPTDAKAALAARMARFKSLQAAKESGRKATEREVRDAEDRSERLAKLSKLADAHTKASYKLLKTDDPDFERKRNWDYTVEESESWDKRLAKKARARDNNAFADYRGEANKVYKRQIGQMSKVDLAAYAEEKATKLQRQVQAGLLQLVETDAGEIYTVDSLGRVNTAVEEEYSHDHKPSKEAIDRLVGDIEKGEKARLEARRKRGIRDEQDQGDITYINQKNKQFNDKLGRFYNRYTTEIRESFERGTAI